MSRIKNHYENMGEQISIVLKEQRIERGWSQSELAERAGLDRKTVNRMENNRYAPSFQTLHNVSQALGISIGTLLGDE